MTALTADLTGNWNDVSVNTPWAALVGAGPGGIPGFGDNVSVNTAIYLTVPTGVTAQCGTSADNITTYDIDVAGTGRLIIANGGLCQVKGNLRFVGGTGSRLQIEGNGVLEIDATPRVTLTSAGQKVYRILGGDSGEWTCYIRGTDRNNLGEIKATAGSYWYHNRTAGGTLKGLIDIEYGKFTRMWNGVASVSGGGWTNNRNAAGVAMHIDYLVMDACSFIIASAAGTGTADIRRVFSDNSVSGQVYTIQWGGFGASASATMTECVFDTSINGDAYANVTVTECYWFKGGGGGTFGVNSNNNILSQDTGGDPGTVQHLVSGSKRTNSHVSWDRSTNVNPHWSSFSGAAGAAPEENGRIFIYNGVDTSGDCFLGQSSTAAAVITCKNALFVPNTNGSQPGTWVSLLNDLLKDYKFEHNTGVISNSTTRGISLGEYNYAHPPWGGRTAEITQLQSNLAFEGNSVPTTAMLFHIQNGQDPAGVNPLVAANATHNWVYGSGITTVDKVYDISGAQTPQAAPPFTDDIVSVNPNLIQFGRRPSHWAAYYGAFINASGNADASQTDANAHNLLYYAYRDEMSPGGMCQNFIEFIRRGYIPTNEVGRLGGHDGTTPGMFGAWAPALTSLTADENQVQVTTNCGDGNIHVAAIPTSVGTTALNFFRAIDNEDHARNSILSMKVNTLVTVAGVQTIDVSSLPFVPGETYQFHCWHVASDTGNNVPGQAEYLRTSEPIASSSFTVSGGSSNSLFGSLVSSSLVGSLVGA